MRHISLKPLNEQVVVIVGASSGMGREAALDFASRGAKVVISARSDDALDSIVHEIEAKGGLALAVPADVSDFAQVKHVADRAVERFGRIDTWAHFAGAAVYARFEETTPEEFKRIIDVNLTGAAFGAMAALPHLRRAGGGALIQVSSVEAEVSLPYSSAYASSKHGMRGYLDALRMELKHDRAPIAVTNIMPTGINTPFFDHARTKLGVKPMPIPPVYQPGNVTRAVLFAAEHPTDELIVGGAGAMFVWMKRLMPRLTDTMLEKVAFRGQRTSEPRSHAAPDNVFEAGRGDTRIEGDFGRFSRRTSIYTWLQTHPWLKRGLEAAAVVGIVGALTVGARRGNY